ncbi:MAG: aspartate-semialdehyde dehydrogenase [Candidatus Eremiobacteraeota bacterium]|nr:aspartate-semialdehyde dehydrogenase [Candidatus Eremiobacteraeota bacterium]
MRRPLVVAVVGATGLVGRTLLRLLEERSFPLTDLRLYASSDSDGKALIACGRRCIVRSVRAAPVGQAGSPFSGSHVTFFAAGASVSRLHARSAAAAGSLVIDKSAAFRLHANVPLVVPEVNIAAAQGAALIANPNCATIPLALALAPVARAFGLSWVSACTYQSVSGAGRAALAELEAQCAGADSVRVLPRRIAGNVFPENGPFDADGNSEEEAKISAELQKILGLPKLAVSATSVRVPVRIGHGEALSFGTLETTSLGRVREVLRSAPGLIFAEGDDYAAPADVAGTDEVVVGRLRPDRAHPGAFMCWIASDNLRKGAATNAVQIAEAALGVPLTSAK